ncbi:MAG: S8 family serine peptidase [Bacteroidales bacterium]|nr:S8 family serine peptidase [Bacteroidales bacterium]
MKKHSFFIAFLLFLSSVIVAQPKVEQELQQLIMQRCDDMISINIVFKSQIDRKGLKSKTLLIKNTEIKKDVVINELKNHSQKSQTNILELLKSEEKINRVANISCHWLSNSICCDAKREVIEALSFIDEIDIIGLNKEVTLICDNLEDESLAETLANNTNATPHVLQINADDVWALGYTGKNVVVAVLDSGTNFDHYDLSDHLWSGYADCDGDGIADDIIHGWNFASKDIGGNSNIKDDFGHGTHCAGIVCGDGTSGNTTGIAPDASLMTLKIVNRSGGGTPEQMIKGVEFAVENGADILSMSLGFKNSQIGDAAKTSLRKTFENVLEAGVIVCAAAGNDGNSIGVPNNIDIPASCPPPYIHEDQMENSGGISSIVCVGAVYSNDEYASFSSQGPSTWQGSEWDDYAYNENNIGLIRPDIVAPGNMIYSLKHDTNNKYKFNSGTSQATPCVAGVMALMLEKNPNLTPAEICEIIENTAVKLGDKKNNLTGSGRIDALNAINGIESSIEKPFVKLTGFSPTKANQGALDICLTLRNFGKGNSGESTTTILTTNDNYVSINDDTKSLGIINSNEEKEITFSLNIDSATPNGHNLLLKLTTTDGELVWNDELVIKIDAEPKIVFNSKSIETIEAGEDVWFDVELINNGTVATTDKSSVTLSSTSPYVSFIKKSDEINTLSVGGKESVSFGVNIDKSITDNSTVNFDIYTTPNNFSQVKDIIYEFETEKNDYGYYDEGFCGWTTFDASNDDRDHPWWHSSNYVSHYVENIGEVYSGKGCLISEAYCMIAMIEYSVPIDNYLVSPKIRATKDSKFKFKVRTDNIFYNGQHFGVAISETGNNSADSFTTIKEWIINDVSGTEWQEYSIDLSEYEGKDIYVAIRNFFTEEEWTLLNNGYDLHLLLVDDAMFESVIDVSDNVKYNNYSYFSVKVKSDPIPAPSNIVATAIDEKSIKLSWDAVANVQSYNIYNSDCELITTVNGITQFTDTNLRPNTEYWYKISSVYNGSESELSEWVSATTNKADYNIAIKSVVYNEAMEVGDNEIEITFVNDGKYNQQARSTITLSTEDEYLTIVTNNINLNALDVNEEATKIFTISLNEIPPFGYKVNINANITQKFDPFLSWDCPFSITPNTTIGIEESKNNEETLFAIVNGEVLTINGIEGNAHIWIYDVSGMCIHNSTSNNSSLSVNIGKYNKGIYIVRVKDNSGVKVQKVYFK